MGHRSGLVDILGDMLRSALAWERDHPSRAGEDSVSEEYGLTGIHPSIHCPPDAGEGKARFKSPEKGVRVNDSRE